MNSLAKGLAIGTRRERAAYALFGAYVADAAALGLHWLYDADRVASLSPLAFRTPNAADFEGCKGVFVHGGKRAGEVSHYGAQLRVAAQSLIARRGFDAQDHAARFVAAFGPCGAWRGYADRPTKMLLSNIEQGVEPAGAEDDQIPGLSRLVAPAIAGLQDVDAFLASTANHPDARAFAPAVMAALSAAIDGATPREAAETGASAASGQEREALRAAILDGADAASFAGVVGRACPIRQSAPVIFHILAHAGGYRGAVEANIRAAGDSCGRAAIIGAVFAAGGSSEIPLDWVLRLEDGAALWAEALALAALRSRKEVRP